MPAALFGWTGLAEQAAEAIFPRWWMACVAGTALSGPGHSAPLFWPFPKCVPGSSSSSCSISQGSSATTRAPGHVYVLVLLPFLLMGKQLLWALWPLFYLLTG